MLSEFYDEKERNIECGLPKPFNGKITLIESTTPKALFYNVTLPDLTHLLQAYNLRLKCLRCDPEAGVGSLIVMYIPWSQDYLYHSIRPQLDGDMTLKLMHSRPLHNNQSVQLHIYTDPACVYSASLTYGIKEVLGQFVRNYFILLPGYLCAQLLAVFAVQLQRFSTPAALSPSPSAGVVDSVNSPETSILQPVADFNSCQRNVFVQLLVLLGSYAYHYVISISKFSTLYPAFQLPLLTDQEIMMQDNIWNVYIPVILYSVAFCYISLLALFVGLFASLFAKLFSEEPSEEKQEKIRQRLKLVRNLAIGVSIGLNEIAGVAIITIVLFVKIAWMMKRSTRNKTFTNSIRINFTVLISLILIVSLNSHILFMWLKEFRSLNLTFDNLLTMNNSPMGHRMLSLGLIVTLFAALSMYIDFPRPTGRTSTSLYFDLSWIAIVVGQLVICYASVNVYNITLYMASVLSLILLPDLLSFAHK